MLSLQARCIFFRYATLVRSQAFKTAIGDKKGITRYASVSIPMDEALATVHIDISGRSHLVYHVEGLKDKLGSFDTELDRKSTRLNSSHVSISYAVLC